MQKETRIEKAFELACEEYADIAVDVNKAIQTIEKIPISIHCWQTDDVAGCEMPDAELSGGGIQATGNYPGGARNIGEIREDLEKVYSLLPGKHRLNLHAIYGDFNGKFVDRDKIEPEHFQSWVDWAKKTGIGMDFNCSMFAHPKADAGFTLSSKDRGIREFWIEHVKRCREIGAFIGKELANPCIHNIWIPDGSKDMTVDKFAHRAHLKESLDTILKKEYETKYLKDAVESKLFGIGLEAYTVGSHEFYLGYAVRNNLLLTLDLGHFHPTEEIADKVSAVFQFINELLFHISRPVRWDSDHVVILNDEVRALMREIVWADKLGKVHLGLDFFDASINRIGAYVIGARAAQKALLLALLDPVEKMREFDNTGKNFERLALMEEAKAKPFGAVWDYYCMTNNVPVSEDFIADIQTYEKNVLSKRA